MSNMFSFLQDMGNYKDRKVAHWEDGKKMVDTCCVSDGVRPFETAFMHPDYNGGKMIIVEAYNTKAEAEAGHGRWLKTMQGKLPKTLTDCCNSGVGGLAKAFGSSTTFNRLRRKP